MGREKVLAVIRRYGTRAIIGGSVLTFVGLLPSVLFYWVYNGFDVLHVLFSFPLLAGLAFLVYGIRVKRDPEKAGCLKRNPNLLMQADELYQNIEYEDDFIMFSDRVIANKHDVMQMAYFQDIIWITVQNLIDTIYQKCPNARIGYSEENRMYCEQIQQRYKNR